MAVDDALLRVPQPQFLGDGDNILELVHIEVTARAVVVLEQGKGSAVPAAQHFLTPRVGGVKIDARLGTADGGAGDGKFDLHDLGEGHHFVFGEAFAHARAATGSAVAQTVDDDPAFSPRGFVLPFEDNLRPPGFVFFQQFFHFIWFLLAWQS